VRLVSIMLSYLLVAALAFQAVAGCGLRGGSSSRIVGGDEATAHNWPWQASLRSSGWFGSSHICGATIINERYLITAAHCVDGATTRSLTIVVGDHHKGNTQASEVTHTLQRIRMHQQYDGNSLSTEGLPHDIALLEVQTPMQFNQYVQPACLPGEEDLDLVGNNDCWITGWGLTQGSQDENVLQELNIEVRTNRDCENIWGQGMIRNSQVCLGHGQTGACNGDSGGPLHCKVNGRWVLAGATSWGRSGCQTAGYPSVYTRVSSYLSWIAANAN